jgi:hypothetical protein
MIGQPPGEPGISGFDDSETAGFLSWSGPFNLIYIFRNVPSLFLLGSLFIVIKGIHQRRFQTLITPNSSISWRRFFSGFFLWLLLATIQTLIEFLMQPQAFSWSFQPGQWLQFLPLALLLTPLQTTAEELFFRGYLLQGLGLLIRQPGVLAIAASMPFALVHFSNPEMDRGALWIGLTYFLLALFLTLLTLRDDRLELALGVHAANNLFIVLFVNSKDSILQTPALITQTMPADPRITFIGLLLGATVCYLLLFGHRQI